MIIGVLESGDVQVFDDLDTVLAEWAAYPRDLLSGVITLYDEDGVWLEPLVGGRARRWSMRRTKPGDVTLRRNADSDWPDPIGTALGDAVALLPNRHVASLAELRTRFPMTLGESG